MERVWAAYQAPHLLGRGLECPGEPSQGTPVPARWLWAASGACEEPARGSGAPSPALPWPGPSPGAAVPPQLQELLLMGHSSLPCPPGTAPPARDTGQGWGRSPRAGKRQGAELQVAEVPVMGSALGQGFMSTVSWWEPGKSTVQGKTEGSKVRYQWGKECSKYPSSGCSAPCPGAVISVLPF